jgi:hypothetical protein
MTAGNHLDSRESPRQSGITSMLRMTSGAHGRMFMKTRARGLAPRVQQ